MKGPQPLHIFAPASAYAGPGFRFANNVCEPPAAQSAAFEIRSGGVYAARLEALWASKSASPTADGKIEDFDAAPLERPKWPLLISFSFSPPTSASPGWGSGSAEPFGPSSNLQPRKRGLRPAVTEGDRKMMQLEKMNISFFRRVLTLSTPSVPFKGTGKLSCQKIPVRYAALFQLYPIR